MKKFMTETQETSLKSLKDRLQALTLRREILIQKQKEKEEEQAKIARELEKKGYDVESMSAEDISRILDLLTEEFEDLERQYDEID